MEQINIRKFREYENGEIFGIRYEGIPNNVFDKEKVDKLIDAFLSKEALHHDMLRNVAYLRTILRDAQEKLLVVQYENQDNEKTVKYDNGNLFLFKSKVKYDDKNYIEVEYSLNDGLKTSFWNKKDEFIIEYPQSETIKEKSNEIIDHIAALINVDCVHLDDDSKKLIAFYRLFYNENPDFTREDINVKVQSMLSILIQFNIYFGDSYGFCISEKMPESLKLLQMINKLFPLGEVVVVDDLVELNPKTKKAIKMIGEMIREEIGNETDINEALIIISKTIYAGRYNIDSVHDIQELVEYPNINLTYKEAKSSVQLVKKIDKKLEENI